MSRFYERGSEVLWNPVGRDPDELLLVHEGDETRIFVLSGRTGAALWTRLDGTRSVKDLARDLAGFARIPLEAALARIEPLVRELEREGLIRPASSTPDARPCDPLAWPSDPDDSSLVPFSPDALAEADLVAVGSYQGGYNNTGGGSLPCGGGQGGVNDVGGQYACRPGDGNGFINAGWFGTPCNN